MTSKASNQRDITDVIKKQKRDNKKASGIARAQASGISGSDTAIAGGQKTQAGSAGASNVTQDLLMNTYDIRDVDRLYFSTTAGSADVLTANDTGIESKSSYNGTSYTSYGLNFQVPANNIHTFFIGTTEKINIGTGYIILNDNVVGGGSIQLSAMTAPSATGTTQRKLYVDTADNHLKIRTNTTSIDLETSSGSGAGLADNNVWTGTNTFQDVVSMTGSTVNIGDATTDRVNFISKLGTDIDLNDYDIENIDRLFFSTSGTDNLTASDMGIAANSNDNDYLTYNVPSGYHRFKVNGNLAMSVGPTSNPGLTVENSLWVSGSITATGNVTFQQEVTLGNASSDDINIVGNIDTDISMAASKKIRAYTSTEIGYYVKNATSSVGSEGTVQIPTKNTGVGNAATADSDFGSEIGCIGLYTLGNPTLVIKYSSSGWQGIIFGSSGNPTQYQF